uniref:Coiled-coil domain containing 175 n=1 Tax=Astyanax mexicanus TaxID=7994 RepID=W5LJF7_ASTMX
MAVCLVPDFPAVRIALEHLAESKQLREGVIFSEEESHHLREIADAIKALETSRKAVLDELEVETIEMSKLRHQVLSQGDDVVNEVLGVAAARDVNAAQLNQLQTEMKSVVEEIELMERRRKVLQGENARLPDREPMKSSHAIIIEQLNQQLSEKSSTQISLNQLKIHIQNTEQKITQVQKTKTHLIQNLLQERRSFSERKEMLQKESISQLETSISRRSLKYKEQLEDEIRKSEELHRQEFIDKELQEEKDSFLQKIQTLQERTAAVENQLEEEEKMKSVHLESVAEISASFRAQRKSEDDALADQHSVSTRLEKSKQRLEEHMASIARNKLKVKEMEEEIKQLQEVRAAFEVERDELCQSLKTLKDQHEHGVRERRSEIALMKTKHSDLQDEEKRLESVRLLMDQLSNTVTRAEEESRQIEISYLHQIQHLTTEADSIREARLQKEEALKVQESVLQEVEAQFNIELSRYETLKTQLKNRKKNLELPIQQMKEQITQLLKPKEELKNALQTLRAQHMQMLNNQSDKISSTEKLIYRNGLILEQVSMENSRLHLVRIELMKEDISTAETEREKSSEQKSWMKKEVQFLSSLTKAWTTDKLESIDRDQKLLVDLNNFILKTQQRRQQAGDIQSRLEEEITRM